MVKKKKKISKKAVAAGAGIGLVGGIMLTMAVTTVVLIPFLIAKTALGNDNNPALKPRRDYGNCNGYGYLDSERLYRNRRY